MIIEQKIDKLIEEANALKLRQIALNHGIIPDSNRYDWKATAKNIAKRQAHAKKFGGTYSNSLKDNFEDISLIKNDFGNRISDKREIAGGFLQKKDGSGAGPVPLAIGSHGSVDVNFLFNNTLKGKLNNKTWHTHPFTGRHSNHLRPSDMDIESLKDAANHFKQSAIDYVVVPKGQPIGLGAVKYKAKPNEDHVSQVVYNPFAKKVFNLNGKYILSSSKSLSPEYIVEPGEEERESRLKKRNLSKHLVKAAKKHLKYKLENGVSSSTIDPSLYKNRKKFTPKTNISNTTSFLEKLKTQLGFKEQSSYPRNKKYPSFNRSDEMWKAARSMLWRSPQGKSPIGFNVEKWLNHYRNTL